MPEPLNHLVLIACVSIIVACIAYFFYWNRFIGSILGFFIRLFWWGKDGSSVWVEIGAIQFSILTGRILLKDVRYHTSNQTLRIVKGEVVWRYWLWRTTDASEIGQTVVEDQEGTTNRALTCRIQVSLQGFEWFLYNRTAAYESIITQMEQDHDQLHDHSRSFPPSQASRPQSTHSKADDEESLPSTPHIAEPDSRPPSPQTSLLGQLWRHKAPSTFQRLMASLRSRLPNLDPKDLLPIGLVVTKGSIVCGNPSTPSLFVADFRRAEGTYGIVPSRSKFDLYKQLLTLSFQQPLMQFAYNPDYRESMVGVGEVVSERVSSSPSGAEGYLSFTPFKRLHRLLNLHTFIPRHFPTHENRHRLPRRGSLRRPRKPLSDGIPADADMSTYEYAIERKILEAPSLEVSYYVDVVGEVPEGDADSDSDPEWGVDLVIRQGVIKYGPWADRQRAEMQRAFFPGSYRDMQETPPLQPGDNRAWTALKVFVELRDDTVLHIPFREGSKNWLWDGLNPDSDTPITRPGQREAAYIYLSSGDRSSINYTMPMVLTPEGYESTLEVHLDTPEITSSLNDITMLTAESLRVRCALPTPLQWNGERTWAVALSVREPILYLLRDHINMFTDLGKDWSSATPAPTTRTPTDYWRFVPTVYVVELELIHYELNLYVNDHNIIDKPLTREENAIFTLCGPLLSTLSTIPSTTYHPESSTVSFTVDVSGSTLNLSLPRWNTNALHLPKAGNSIATLGKCVIDGRYSYYAEAREDAGWVDALKLDVAAEDITFKLLGWSIRYMMIFKDNYLGSFTQFSTLYEYLDRRRNGLPVGDPVMQKYRVGKSNMMQAEVTVDLRRGCVVLPAGLPGYEKTCMPPDSSEHADIGSSLFLNLPELQLYFRMHDYYMEMSLNVDTIGGHIESHCPEDMKLVRYQSSARDTVVIDGLDITANRLFGPPPKTITYVCIWEIQFGHVKGILSATDAFILASVGKAFAVNFNDIANAPAVEFLPDEYPDLTFVKVSVEGVDLTWKSGNAAMLLSIPGGLKLDSNDLGGQFHRKVTSVRVPELIVRILLAADSQHSTWLEALGLTTDIYLDLYASPEGWRQLAAAQEAFVREQDLMTGRAQRMFALLKNRGSSALPFPQRQPHQGGVFLPQPALSSFRQYLSSNAPAVRGQKEENPYLTYSSNSSDGEEGISEADRDARLAQKRGDTPVTSPFAYEDQNMTSGDESDNEDLTDGGDSIDSDWSDLDADPQTPKAPLRQYSPFVPQFIAQNLSQPILWRGPPFKMSKVRTQVDEEDATMPPTLDDETIRSYSSGPANDANTTVIRFASRREFDIRLNPLVVSAVAILEIDLERAELEPELCIDSLISAHIGSLSDGPDPSRQSLVFDLYIPSYKFAVLQHVIPRTFSEPDGASPASSASKIVIAVHGARLMGTMNSDGKSISCSVHSIDANLQANVPWRVSGTLRPPETVMSVRVTGISGHHLRDHLEIYDGTLEVDVGHGGPEHLLILGKALQKHLKPLRATYRRWSSHSKATVLRIMRHVIEASQGQATIDPLSAVQPLYLVQSGRPNRLRSDPAFRFLFHLRNSLWVLHHQRKIESFSWRHVPADIESLVPLLESRLELLDPDAMLPALDSIILKLRRSHDIIVDDFLYPFSHIELKLDQVSAVIRDVAGGSAGEVNFTSISLSVFSRMLDLVDKSAPRSMTVSQTSLGHKGPKTTRKTSVSIELEEASLVVFPGLMRFVQDILRVKRVYQIAGRRPGRSKVTFAAPSADVTNIEFLFKVSHLRAQAVAATLILELGSTAFKFVSSCYLRRGSLKDASMNHCILFDDLFLHARSPADVMKQSDQDILASLVVSACSSSIITQQDPLSELKVRVILGVNNFHFTVPRSALRLYRFYEQWKADFLPGIEATVKELLSEVQKAPSSTSVRKPRKTNERAPSVELQMALGSLGLFLQVMHGTWLTWEVKNCILHTMSSVAPTRMAFQQFDLQISSQLFSVSPNKSVPDDATTAVKLELPPVSVTGNYEGEVLNATMWVEILELKVRPSHWDTLLAVQQKFGQDFNDLVALAQETRAKRSTPTPKPPKTGKPNAKSEIVLKMRGFRIGLEGIASTLYFECQNIDGSLRTSPAHTWSIVLSDLSLSLASGTNVLPDFNQRHRSAFVIIDLRVIGSTNEVGHSPTSETLDLKVTKIHAVMQPSSIGEVGDFVDNLQAEMFDRRERRAPEVAALRMKAQSILKTFEVKPKEQDPSPASLAWLQKYTINILVSDVGVAFPLTHAVQLELPVSGSRDSSEVRAFLFSIAKIQFGTQRGETGQVIIKGFSFQFVPRFHQNQAKDFSGPSHQTRNRLLYPEMTAQVRSSGSAMDRQIYAKATVSGFILDLDSSIPDYVLSLIDVYREGKERVSQLSASVALHTQVEAASPTELAPLESTDKHLPSFNFFGDLVFLSGKVRVYSDSAAILSHSRSLTQLYDPTDDQVLGMGAEIFRLPVVSVWTEYRSANRPKDSRQEFEPSVLMFKSTVHSSQNTLRPTLLPFITELVSHVENRLTTVSRKQSDPPQVSVATTSHVPLVPQNSGGGGPAPEPMSSMQISFSLRIDQSKLELTCMDDVNVVAGVNWESGGFVVNVSPGASKVTFTGSVGGLTVGLKHGFLSEDCVKLDARNLAFSMTFAKMLVDQTRPVSFVSLVLDTEFHGSARFSRLQDILCFKAVWLDRIPVMNGRSSQTKESSKSIVSSAAVAPSQEFTNVILVRIRQIKLEVDLGQSISTVVFDLINVTLRSKLTDTLSEVSVSVGDVKAQGAGNVSGYLGVSNCVFQTVRRLGNLTRDETGRIRMLELRLTSDALLATLESDHQRLLHYRADPMEIEIYDDWFSTSTEPESTRPLQLAVTLTSPEIIAISTIGAIPKLMTYAIKFQANLDSQREAASRESKTFRISRTPKPENPLSAVAEAMIESARSRFKEESGVSRVIMQHMSLRLDLLRLLVFPRNMGDSEVAQFIGRSVRARLDRLVRAPPAPTKRDIQLSFLSMVISRFTQLGAPSSPDLDNGKVWLNLLLKDASEANIVGLPAMNMHMTSEEVMEDQTRVLLYDFDSKFVRDGQGGPDDFGEDIYISLNVGLYSWLTVLRKTFGREMDQVRTASDLRTVGNASSPLVSSRRKPPPPELLQLPPDTPRSPLTLRFPLSPRSASLMSPHPISTTPRTASLQVPLSAVEEFPPADTPTSAVTSTTINPMREGQHQHLSVLRTTLTYRARDRHIERLTMRQLGEATPDVMHPFFMKKAGFSLEDSLPQYVNEYATTPLEEIMEVLLKLYSKQLLVGVKHHDEREEEE